MPQHWWLDMIPIKGIFDIGGGNLCGHA